MGKASKELVRAYDKIATRKDKFGTSHKAAFHMHSPASYDYRIVGNSQPQKQKS